jgi:hypothetical protein
LVNTGKRAFDATKAGWWLADIAPWPLLDVCPDPAGPNRRGRKLRWVTTPTLALLDELGKENWHGGFTIVDSWTGPGRRALTPWAERLRDAWAAAWALPDPCDRERVTDAIKAGGNAAIGLLANKGMRSVYRPDWAHTVRALARANGFRRVWKEGRLGRWPVLIETDAIHYDHDSKDPLEAFPASFVDRDGKSLLAPLGVKLGTYTAEHVWRVRESR